MVVDDLDLWAEAGFAGACKKVVDVKVKGGLLTISFPEVKVGEAIISAIAIAAKGEIGAVSYTHLSLLNMVSKSWVLASLILMPKTA